MEFLIDNWFLIIIAIAVIGVAVYFIIGFTKFPSDEKLQKVREWLLYAVTEAEKELGSGTGQIKLRYVYDMFITKFPYMVKVIPFESFSLLVDEALDKFRAMLETNKKIKDYVEGAKAE